MRELFNFRGRASRLTYWRIQLLCLVLVGAVMLAGDFATQAVDRVGGVVYAAFLPILVIEFAVALKRLHDRNKGVGWLLFFLVYPLAAEGAGQTLVASSGLNTNGTNVSGTPKAPAPLSKSAKPLSSGFRTPVKSAAMFAGATFHWFSVATSVAVSR